MILLQNRPNMRILAALLGLVAATPANAQSHWQEALDWSEGRAQALEKVFEIVPDPKEVRADPTTPDALPSLESLSRQANPVSVPDVATSAPVPDAPISDARATPADHAARISAHLGPWHVVDAADQPSGAAQDMGFVFTRDQYQRVFGGHPGPARPLRYTETGFEDLLRGTRFVTQIDGDSMTLFLEDDPKNRFVLQPGAPQLAEPQSAISDTNQIPTTPMAGIDPVPRSHKPENAATTPVVAARPTPKTSPETTPEFQTGFLQRNSNLRAAPGSVSAKIGTADLGSAVTLLARAADADGDIWYRVRIDATGQTGFVYSALVGKTAPPPPAPAATEDTTRYLLKNSNLRAGPGTGFQILAKGKVGQKAVILSETRDAKGDPWFRVTLPGLINEAYVFGALLGRSPPDAASQPTETTGAQADSPESYLQNLEARLAAQRKKQAEQRARAAQSTDISGATLLPGLHKRPTNWAGGHIAFCYFKHNGGGHQLVYAQHKGRLRTTRDKARARVPAAHQSSAKCKLIADFPCMAITFRGDRMQYFGGRRLADLMPLLRGSRMYSPISARVGCF
ncbi:MAG: SH3 domain-containing protein [Pelagimonas sp.]|jgi:hypothetical protein|nr:SH3 domain-containing protein [Pelagimonas sp.]